MLGRFLPTLVVAAGLGASSSAGDAVSLQGLPNAASQWAEDGAGGPPSFTKHVVPLLNELGCSNRTCHGSFQGQAGFRLSLFGYDPVLDHVELTNDPEKGPRIDPEDPDASLVLEKALGEVAHDGGERFERGGWEHRLLRRWIADGAGYDPKTASYLDRLEVVPKGLVLSNEETVHLRVIGTFSDGTREEVTPLTDFSSNDDSVAIVTDSGRVSVEGFGDTHVIATYAGGVVSVPVVVPQDTPGPFPEFPPNNEIDRLVAAKLRTLGVHPSGLCTDEEFVRRVFVDVIGTLPTSDEVRSFLDDDRPDKRRRLVDDLLHRPEYAVYWASIVADWTGNDRLNLNNALKVANLYQQWLEARFAENTPWDELVGGFVTATSLEGRPLGEYLAENAAVSKNLAAKNGFDDGTYARRRTLDLFWLKRGSDRAKTLATRSANAFLGVSIQCAECHKHPFDRWTQDDFEGFVSFFRCVSITDLDGTERSGGRYDYDKVALYPGVDRREQRNYERHPPKLLAGPVVESTGEASDPRVRLWEWMRSPENPYFAANVANRLWAHYTGHGLVDPVDDVSAANPPSNRELLDWMASDFVDHDFDLKHLHRRILNSRTYQLSYVPNETNRFDHRNHSHARPRRMRAEVALDALARVTGTSLVFNGYAVPEGTRAIGLSAPSRYGRSEYFLQTFGRGEREQICSCDRSDDVALAQALFLINDEDVHARIGDANGRVVRLLATIDEDGQLVDELYLTALSRFPTSRERETVLAHFRRAPSRREAAEDLAWSLLNVREFLFVK